MIMRRAICLLLYCSAGLWIGCGDGDERKVIQPTESYQLTEQEQKNQKQFDAMRNKRE